MIQSRMGYSLIQIPLHPAISSYTRNHSIVSWWCIYKYTYIYIIYIYIYTHIYAPLVGPNLLTPCHGSWSRPSTDYASASPSSLHRPLSVPRWKNIAIFQGENIRGIAMIYVVFSSNYQSHSSKPQWKLSTDKWLPSTLDEITQKRCECWLFLSKNTGFAAWPLYKIKDHC
jgi:hypothetical protein